MKEPIKIGIIIGSVREGRNAEAVAKWMYDFAKNRGDENVEYELVDLKDYNLAIFGTNPTPEQEQAAKA